MLNLFARIKDYIVKQNGILLKIKNQFDFEEFFEDSSQKTGGIGVLKK